MHYLNYYFFRATLLLFRAIPFRTLYAMSGGIRYLLQDVVKYRKKVIRGQLDACFPELSEADRQQIEDQSYANIADLLVESIKGIAAPAQQIIDRVHYPNPDVINKHLAEGRSVILTGGHQCNWEWAAITVAHHIKGEVVGVYKKLSNPLIEDYVRTTRARLGMTLMEMKNTMQSIEDRQGKPAVYVLVADQWPSNVKRAHWIPFFGRETACLPGVDFIGRTYQMAVVTYEMTRQKRGYYTIAFQDLIIPDQQTPEQTVTRLNMERLEASIRKDPANWLWSHRRWKHPRGV